MIHDSSLKDKKCTCDGVCACGASVAATLEVFETISTDLTDRSDLDFTKNILFDGSLIVQTCLNASLDGPG